MPGSRRLWTYSARPVTLSHDSRRGTERPTWFVSVACVARFMDRSLQGHADQVLLICGGAVQVALDRHVARRLRRLLEERIGNRFPAQHFLGSGEARRPA